MGVPKRKCGTCRYFEESSLPGNGWCNHPQWRTSTDTLIMVRKDELRCRNGWLDDLWAPTPDDQPSTRARLSFFPAKPVAPATVADITAIISAQTVQPAAELGSAKPVFEDVVVNETAMPHRPEPVAPSISLDTRTAIQRARERHRIKFPVRPRTVELAENDTQREVNQQQIPPDAHEFTEGVPSQAAQNTQEPHVLGDSHTEAPIDTMPATERPIETTYWAERLTATDPFETIPEIDDGFALPRNAASSVPSLFPNPLSNRAWERPNLEHEEADSAFATYAERTLLSESTASPPATLPPDLSAPSSYDLALDRARQFRAGVRTRPATEPIIQDREPPHTVPSLALATPQVSVEAVDSSANIAHVDLTELEFASEFEVDQAFVAEVASSQLSRTVNIDLITEWDDPAPIDLPEHINHLDITFEDDRLIEIHPRLAPEIPRMCLTCRDFRPAESGERGWCTNTIAFSHRRMVNAEDLTCEQSFGCWWLPSDAIRLPLLDITAHAMATPLMDTFIAKRMARRAEETAPQRKRS